MRDGRVSALQTHSYIMMSVYGIVCVWMYTLGRDNWISLSSFFRTILPHQKVHGGISLTNHIRDTNKIKTYMFLKVTVLTPSPPTHILHRIV